MGRPEKLPYLMPMNMINHIQASTSKLDKKKFSWRCLALCFFLRNSEMSLRTPEGTSSFRDAICNEKIEVFFESYSQQNGMASWVSNIARTWHPCNCFFFFQN